MLTNMTVNKHFISTNNLKSTNSAVYKQLDVNTHNDVYKMRNKYLYFMFFIWAAAHKYFEVMNF